LNEGRRNESGTKGVATWDANSSGFSYKVRLNGLKNGKGDSYTGTRYPTILHELLHVATTTQLYYQPNSKEANDLAVLLKIVKDQVRLDIKNNKSHPAITRILRKANTLKNIKEIITWGLTDSDFQDYLSQIKVGKTNGFSKLVNIVRNLFGLNQNYDTALESIMRT
jgi:hypothetical protein